MLACPPGTQPVPNRNGCCYTCQAVAVCPDIPCAPIACGPGSHLEILPDQCCPTCVADKCEDQRIAYIRLRGDRYDDAAREGWRALLERDAAERPVLCFAKHEGIPAGDPHAGIGLAEWLARA